MPRQAPYSWPPFAFAARPAGVRPAFRARRGGRRHERAGQRLAAVTRMIARRVGAMTIVGLLLAAPLPAGAQTQAQAEARTDSDPTKPVLFSLRPEFYRVADGVWRTQAIARYDQALQRNRRWLGGKRGLLFRMELPVATGEVPAAPRASGLGDGYAQMLLVPRQSGRFVLVAGSGLVLPTATSNLLGGGQWIVAPAVLPVWMLRGVGLAYVKVQDFVSVAGDDRRPSVHFMLVTPTFIRTLGRGSWLLLDSETKTDWRTHRTGVKSGVQYGRLLSGVGIWIKPEVWWGRDQSGDWNLKTGLVWYR
jgi:hypothetical protein